MLKYSSLELNTGSLLFPNAIVLKILRVIDPPAWKGQLIKVVIPDTRKPFHYLKNLFLGSNRRLSINCEFKKDQ
jgi:hypothetical protein